VPQFHLKGHPSCPSLFPKKGHRVPILTPKLSPLQASKLALSVVPVTNDGACAAGAENAGVRAAVGDDFLIRQGLGPLWNAATLDDGDNPGDPLKALRIDATVIYLLHRSVLADLDKTFENAGITYAVFKGAHVREWVYADAALRNPADIDVLIRPIDRERAVRALIAAGYSPNPDAATVSHELALTRHGVEIDVHWHVTRPRRLRIEVSDEIVGRRQRVAGFWAVSNADAVFLMLIHPAFTKYVSSPSMRLIRVVDFLYVVRDHPVEWPLVADLLDRCGVRAAAWTVLTWFQMLHPLARGVPAAFVARIAPGRLRAWYLRAWLRHDLPTRLHSLPMAIQVGFTLLFHDRPSDAWRAIRGILTARGGGTSDPIFLLAQSASAATTERS
jgi:hypothetical protein